MSNTYCFQLGHQPHISTAEIQAVFSHGKILIKNKKYLIIEVEEKLDVEKLMEKLGGTIKIGERIKEPDIAEFLAKSSTDKKIHFSISGANNRKTALLIKKQLKQMGRSVRFIEPKNTATILHNKLIKKQGDLTKIDNHVFVTKAIQPFEEFGQRDYDRPGSDDKSGMLPPKLARIMINLSQASEQSVLLDPFCGSGTVLLEAISMGYKKIIGSDAAEKAIKDTEKNIDWLIKKDELKKIRYKLHKTQAQRIHEKIKTGTIDLIVSEPYLGQPLKGGEKGETLKKQTYELGSLYTDSFKSFHRVLKNKGVVIFIIPRFKTRDEWISVDCIEKIKKAGFRIVPLSSESDFLLYHRPQQRIGREIWKLIKN